MYYIQIENLFIQIRTRSRGFAIHESKNQDVLQQLQASIKRQLNFSMSSNCKVS